MSDPKDTGAISPASLAIIHRILNFLALLWIIGAELFWLWLQNRLSFSLSPIETTLILLTATGLAAAVQWSRYSLFCWFGRLLAAFCLGNILIRFYGNSLGFVLEDFPRLREIPAGHLLLTISVFTTLIILLFWAIELLRKMGPKMVLAGLFVIGVLGMAAVASDLYFVGKGDPFFASPKYHPFLAYNRMGCFNYYPYSHATERYVNDIRDYHFQQKKPEGVRRIILNGASTVWGHGLEKDEILARCLERALLKKYPEQKFEVITVAWPGKYELNELVDTVITLPHWEPDLVISLNGYNDIAYGEGDGRYEGMPYFCQQLEWVTNLTSTKKFFYTHSYFGRTIWNQSCWSYRMPYGLVEPLRYEPPRYYSYLRLTARNLASLGIPYVFGFCPNTVEREHMTPEERGVLNESQVALKQAILERRIISDHILQEEGQLVYNPMEPLEHLDEPAFFDQCHLYAKSTNVLAEDMAEHVQEWLTHKPKMAEGGKNALTSFEELPKP